VWFSDHWALDLNTTGKWSQGSSEASNHIQHAAGVVYQWDVEKALSRKGKKKYEEIQKIENEKQRVLDSIANANELKEAALLAERQEEEARIAEAQKEKDRLAAIEKAKLDAENAQKAKMEERISQLGTVYYALNSSFLNNESKRVLDAIATLLTNEPEVALKITSHTDSRETDEYNDWLSQRRQNSAIKYLISKGIAAERLTGESFGERSLTNECDDNTPCSEEKHQLNRRSEFTVIKI